MVRAEPVLQADAVRAGLGRCGMNMAGRLAIAAPRGREREARDFAPCYEVIVMMMKAIRMAVKMLLEQRLEMKMVAAREIEGQQVGN